VVDVKAYDVGVLRDPRNMVKAGLPEAQSPVDASRHPPERRLIPVPRPALVFVIHQCNLRDAERRPVRALKEMSGPPTFRSTRTTETNAGSPTGRESYGDGGLVVVAGVTTCQGGRESRPQGEGGQVTGDRRTGEVRVMRNAKPVVDLHVSATASTATVTGEPDDRKRSRRVRAGSGGEPRHVESDHGLRQRSRLSVTASRPFAR
jgi:hypothetical protein